MMHRKKVLHFLCQGELGGQERAIYQLINTFQGDEEVEFGVAIGRDSGYYVEKIKELDVPIIYLNLSGGFSFNFSPAVLRQMRAYDIHHLPDPSPNYIIYSLLAGRGIRRVYTRRGGMKPLTQLGMKKKIKFLAQRALLQRFMDGYSGNTKNATESVRRQYRIQDKDIFVLYNGVDFDLLNPTLPPGQIRAEYGMNRSDFVIGTACRLVHWKRVDVLLKAFARCRIENKTLIVFGDGPERPALQQLVSSLGLNGQVHFAGMVSDMSERYQALDCFVLASSSAESFGNAVVEAMYNEVPSIIMADSDGLREHIQHLETGYIAKDEAGLVRLIERVYRRPAEAAGIAEQAARHVVGKYSIENMKRRYKNFYRQVCGEPLLPNLVLPCRIAPLS